MTWLWVVLLVCVGVWLLAAGLVIAACAAAARADARRDELWLQRWRERGAQRAMEIQNGKPLSERSDDE